MQKNKKSARRRKEIFTAAKKLFEQQGYENTSIDQIVQEAGVAKGTFYYYFSSKEEALGAMMEEMDATALQALQPILNGPAPAPQKMALGLIALRRFYAGSHNMLENFKTLKDELMYYKSLIHSIHVLTAPFVQIIEQGIQEGAFRCEYPTAFAENILTSAHFLLDGDILPTTHENFVQRLLVVQQLLEGGLGLAPGSLGFVADWERAVPAPPKE
ncbi:MAG: TetR/AcrR family transcriptional regulator [Oscillospiraceae bacterium]